MGLWNCFLHPTIHPIYPTFQIGSGLIPASCFSLQTAETTAVYTHSQLAALYLLLRKGLIIQMSLFLNLLCSLGWPQHMSPRCLENL